MLDGGDNPPNGGPAVGGRAVSGPTGAASVSGPPVSGPAVAAKPLTNRHLRVVGSLLAAAAILTIWWILSGRPEKIEAVAPLAVSSSAPVSTPPQAEVVVDVVGKVKNPGIVTLPPGSRVIDAIKAAGGVNGKADTTALNMARVLSDGEQILVGIDPVAPAGGTAGGTAGGGAGAVGAKVNLNSATEAQLDTLPGVGPVTVAAIIAWRGEHGRFSRIEELMEVKGIGPATMAELKPLVTI